MPQNVPMSPPTCFPFLQGLRNYFDCNPRRPPHSPGDPQESATNRMIVAKLNLSQDSHHEPLNINRHPTNGSGIITDHDPQPAVHHHTTPDVYQTDLRILFMAGIKLVLPLPGHDTHPGSYTGLHN